MKDTDIPGSMQSEGSFIKENQRKVRKEGNQEEKLIKAPNGMFFNAEKTHQSPFSVVTF